MLLGLMPFVYIIGGILLTSWLLRHSLPRIEVTYSNLGPGPCPGFVVVMGRPYPCANPDHNHREDS